MKDARFGKEVVCQPSDPLPRRAIFLTAPPQRAYPEIDDAEAEGDERATVGRHRMVVEVSGDDSFQPLSLCRDWLMHSPPQLLFDHLQLRPQAIGPGLPLDLELAPTRLAADEDEAQEAEGLRFAEPAPLAICRRMASELDQPGLLRVERQRVLSQPLTHLVQEAPRVRLVDGVQHGNRRPLDDLVLQRGNCERAPLPVRLGYVDPPRRQRPIGSPMDPRMQIPEIALEVCLIGPPRQTIHSRCRILLEFEECLFEVRGADVMEERSELLLLPLPCCLPYALQRL